jgi:alkanesulfonate monooxygenase
VPVEFLGMGGINDGSETHARSGAYFEQIDSVHAAARAAGRTDMPRIQVAFRPIIAPTEDRAWEKAHGIVDRIWARTAGGQALTRRHPLSQPQNAGSQRLLALAAEVARRDAERARRQPVAVA